MKIKNKIFKNKVILVTGGTGSFGSAFVRDVLANYQFKKLIIFSRDEYKQFTLKNELKNSSQFNKIRFFIGDVRDKNRLNFALKDVNIVIHTAALKQVDTIEYNPFEAINTNVIGTQNLVEASINNNIEKFIALSTDKAASPINLYGASKLTADKLVINGNNYSGSRKIKFSVVRYGNVFGSRGSVVELFSNLIKNKKGSLPITDIRMTRFIITLDQAIEFVIESISRMEGGEIFIPKIPSINVIDLAKAFMPNLKYKVTGLRVGEKIHETMCPVELSNATYEDKNSYIILEGEYKYKNKRNFRKVPNNFDWNSGNNKNFLKIKEIEELLINHGYY